ncbi:MAG: flagellar assembly protein FliW [Pirellulales bacterium]|nr:flagellar assembly protein FliW [Pirellulales bacterium]
MKVPSVRFGVLDVATSDMIRFPCGLLGMESLREWALLFDRNCDVVAWMQSVDRLEVAFAVVSPRFFVPDYEIRLPGSELESLKVQKTDSLTVLTLVGKSEGTITLNLKAPLLINSEHRLGRQVVVASDLPIQYELGSTRPIAMKTA